MKTYIQFLLPKKIFLTPIDLVLVSSILFWQNFITFYLVKINSLKFAKVWAKKLVKVKIDCLITFKVFRIIL